MLSKAEKISLFFTYTFGVAFLTLGGYFYSTTTAFLEKAITVEGLVVDLKVKDDTTYPIVEFKDHTGVQRTHYSSMGSYPPAHFVGEAVEVLYDPNDPKYPLNTRIKSTLDIWGVTLFLTGMGTFFLLVSTLVWYILKYHGGIWFFRKEDRLEYERTGRIH